MSSHTDRRIGLVLASIHTGASNGLWSDIAGIAAASDASLFVFPGGRLQYPDAFEYLRNDLFSLANPGNMDGIISWGSSLGGSASIEAVQQFHHRFGAIPCVTIGMKVERMPDISFDAYTGVLNELLHCITVHRASRIAFIRGPENHNSANDRYRAYRDALRICSIPFDSRLVSDPFGWTDGASALRQLADERNLVPGRDFDTLACASDLMMFDAGKVLEQRGISIGRDLRIVGFNDSRESHLLKVPCTTARMPVHDLATLSWTMVSDLLDRKTTSGPDILLPAATVIRRSCGCEDSFGGTDQARKALGSPEAFGEWVASEFSVPDLLMERKLKPLFSKASSFDDADRTAADSIRDTVESLSYLYLDRGGDSGRLAEALRWYELFFAPPGFSAALGGPLREIFLRQQDLVSKEHAYALSVRKRMLSAFEYDLLCVRSLSAMIEVMVRHLPSLGIGRAYLVLYGEEGESVFQGGFEGKEVLQGTIRFGRSDLLPDPLYRSLPKGVYVVEPLFMENQSLGYLLLETTLFDGSLLEEIRTATSSALKGTFLMDAANRAKELAEQAERSRTEFFANVSEGLRNPFDSIRGMFDSLKSNDCPIHVLRDSIEAIEEEISKATHLLDLTLSQTGALALECCVSDCDPILRRFLGEGPATYRGPSELPALFLDANRMVQVLSIIRDRIVSEGWECILSVSILPGGLSWDLMASSDSWKAGLYRQDPGFSLAERIVLMMGGSFAWRENRIVILMPWPSLDGRQGTRPDPVSPYLVTSEDLPLSGAGLEALGPLLRADASMIGRKGTIPEGMDLLVWDARRSDLEMQLALHVLLRNGPTSSLPVICFGCPNGYPTVAAAIGSLGLLGQGGTVYVVGTLPPGLKSLVSPQLVVPVSSYTEFCRQAETRPPALVVSSEDRVKLFEQIRGGGVARSVPVVVVKERWDEEEVERLCLIPDILVANTSVADSLAFHARLMALLCKDRLLPPLTGALVKRAVVFLSSHATEQISRWQLAEAVNVSEDYLTRIFRKEIGLSPWDYLARQRVHIATDLLLQTGLTVNEVASQTGFQDQAYFCRVFKKIKGMPPGAVRSKSSD